MAELKVKVKTVSMIGSPPLFVSDPYRQRLFIPQWCFGDAKGMWKQGNSRSSQRERLLRHHLSSVVILRVEDITFIFFTDLEVSFSPNSKLQDLEIRLEYSQHGKPLMY